MKIVKKTAELLLAYYQVKDSDQQERHYFQRLDMITKVCLQQLQVSEDNQIDMMFQILVHLDGDILILDSIGAEEAADKCHELYHKIDVDLRAVISKLTEIDIRIDDHLIDQEFLEQFDVTAELYSLESYKQRKGL